MRFENIAMFLTDVGFVVYWLLAGSGLIPEDWLYADAHDPLVSAWNWSFLPLDLLISATGLGSLWLEWRGDRRAERYMWLSLGLMAASGSNALAFFALRADFDPLWWLLNGWLLAVPLIVVVRGR
jgi:hypothetical protein